MYYAGLRPEEAITLRTDNVILPPRIWDAERQQWQDPPEDQDWGELHLRTATPDAGSEWTDDGSARERRQLKHRAEGDTRIVPTHPELTRLLRHHLANFGRTATAACSPVSGAANCPPSTTAAPGPKPARQPSAQPSRLHRSPGDHTICATPACPPG
jgi:hypothetical protein